MSFFKYMNEDRIENILVDNKIRFTQPIIFNDPFEVKLSIKGFMKNENLIKQYKNELIEILQELYNNESYQLKSICSFEEFILKIDTEMGLKELFHITNNKDLHKKMKEIFKETINNSLGILSLTINPKNLLMWAHYANEHKGFVIELDRENIFLDSNEVDNYIYNGIQKVKYSEERPFKFFEDFQFEEILLTKSKEWEYEEEYRIIKKLEDANQVIGDIYLFKFPKKLIKSIYCGCNMKNSKKKEILDIIKSDIELHHIKVFNLTVSEEFYELESEQIKFL